MSETSRLAAEAALAAVFREEAGRVTAALVRVLGDFDIAEEAVQEAIVAALKRWPSEGVPARPGAWLLIAAKRKAVDRLRRERRYQEKLAVLAAAPASEEPAEVDDRLRLIFTCCHPSLSREAQLALTLRSIVGLTTAEIARAFLVSENTVAQRIVRAKRKIVDAHIPYRIPGPEAMAARLDEVLAVLYLMFNEGYLATAGPSPARHDLADDAEWLASLLAGLLPGEPEVLGLLALMRLHGARVRARFDRNGGLVLLRDQDRGLWDREAISAAAQLVEEALRKKQPGPFQVQAAIAACHARAKSWDETDWFEIVALYGVLCRLAPNPVVRLNRAIALGHLAGPEAALTEIDALGDDLERYHLFHATRAQYLRTLGRSAQAQVANARALELTANPAERALLEQRLAEL